jgi:hypothetical protein
MTMMTLNRMNLFAESGAALYLYRVFRSTDADARLLFVVHLQSE